MLRILSWSSTLGCEKMHPTDYKVLGSKDHMSPVTSLSIATPVKRKRSPSVDHASENVFVQSTVTSNTQASGASVAQAEAVDSALSIEGIPSAASIASTPVVTRAQPSHTESPKTPAVMSTEDRTDLVRQTISTQMNLEILLKHKELRLIEQEMAKCQVALEQLRRCTEIPYPSMQQPSVRVSEGTGPAVRRLGERYPPESPAPWGVLDGPYSRHYAKWLLPDRRFDGGEPEPEMVQTTPSTTASGRSTRGHYVDVLAGKSVKSRARNSLQLQALPAGYGQPKEKATGPMILKRKSDGVMVKLVCPDCGRHDFGSAQGFINHCRIGHSRSFASHDAAAEACGEPVEYNANGTIKGVEPVVNNVSNNVNIHPLVRSAKLLSGTPVVSPNLKGGYDLAAEKSRKTAHTQSSPDFQASTQTPHLSDFIHNQGLSLDLQRLVTDAKTKTELSDSDGEDDDMDIDSPLPITGGRHPHGLGSKQFGKTSTGPTSSNPPKSSLRAGLSAQGLRTIASQHASSGMSHETFAGQLPSPTNDSTQAPSLVDDDEEFDPQSPLSSGDVDENEVDFEIHDEEHGDRLSRFRDLTATQTTCAPNPPSAAPAPSAPKGAEDRHVSFVPTSPDPDRNETKRRKI